MTSLNNFKYIFFLHYQNIFEDYPKNQDILSNYKKNIEIFNNHTFEVEWELKCLPIIKEIAQSD
jgi:hypothetical protein